MTERAPPPLLRHSPSLSPSTSSAIIIIIMLCAHRSGFININIISFRLFDLYYNNDVYIIPEKQIRMKNNQRVYKYSYEYLIFVRERIGNNVDE